MFDVKGKWALVTGASRGIGYLTAIFMAEHGCNLILHSRNPEHTKKVEDEVKALGVKTYCVKAELSEMGEVTAMLDDIDARGIHVDIVFNNAGFQIGYRTNYWETPIEDFDISFKTNFIAAAAICYRLIPKMIEKGFGRVINTTSGIKNEPEQAGYSASKAALDKFTKDLGYKLEGSDVIINLTDPGWCRTDLGGPKAENSAESSIPGVVVGAFVNDKKSGRLFSAQAFTGMTLEEAVEKAEAIDSNY